MQPSENSWSLSRTTKKLAMKTKLCLLLILLSATFSIQAQEATQSLAGVLKDVDTQQAIVGANIIVLDSNPFLGTTSDIDGNYKMDVPLGRINLKVSAIGYEDTFIPNLLVTAGRMVDSA